MQADGLGITPDLATMAGYRLVTTRDELLAVDPDIDSHVSGQFGLGGTGFEWEYDQGLIDSYDTVPFLQEMAGFALDFLDRDPDGFFLVLEQENIDSAGHLPPVTVAKIDRDVFAVLELDETVAAVLDWISQRDDPDDTLLIVTADHETGGLEVLADNGPGMMPTVSYLGDDHTRVPVPVYAWGPWADAVTGTLDNTDIYGITTVPEPTGLHLWAPVAAALGLIGASRRSSAR